nr:putative pyruvate dehydrogenase protein x component, mitochondrial [Quercus suber]
MPALSPTMTEGNIAAWQVKEGDSYSAGDVLLEIETDKATMDVEAQDDGILFKIMQKDGSKGVKVGERIAVTAQPDDDVNSLEMPADEKKGASGKEESKPEPETSEKQNESSKTADSSAKDTQAKQSKPSKPVDASKQARGGNAQKQTYPLYPSVEHLLHENGLSAEDADSIPASGPKGRLLKGDVLAYLGRINQEYPAKSAARFDKLAHLDLSNIQLAKPVTKEEAPKPSKVEPEIPQETELAVPISLSAVIATQKRVQDSLGIFLPLSTFIARASELANEDLPASKRSPTADDLFNAVLGLDDVASHARGHFTPEITGLAPAALSSRPSSIKKPDIIDLLAPKSATRRPASASAVATSVGISSGGNLFSVTAKAGEEARAAEYLERMKLALEKDPGRLVL